MEGSVGPPRSWWLIAKPEGGFLEVLALGLAGGDRVLPVFGFEEDAGLFVRLGVPGTGWSPREIGAGELASLLSGPLSGVGWVAPDPPPGGLGAAVLGSASVRREDFLARLPARDGGGS